MEMDLLREVLIYGIVMCGGGFYFGWLFRGYAEWKSRKKKKSVYTSGFGSVEQKEGTR